LLSALTYLEAGEWAYGRDARHLHLPLDSFMHRSRRSEELLAEWRCPGAGTIGETFNLPAIVSFEAMMSSAERADIVW
jgi:hypothetical protein